MVPSYTLPAEPCAYRQAATVGAGLPGRVKGRDGSVRRTQRGGGRAPGGALRPDSDAKTGAPFGIGFKLMPERIEAIVGGDFPHAARRAIRYGDGWVPIVGRVPYRDVNEYLPKFKQMVAEAGRLPDALPITLFGGTEDADLLKRYRDMVDVARVVTTLPPEPTDKTLPVLDGWAVLIRKVNG